VENLADWIARPGAAALALALLLFSSLPACTSDHSGGPSSDSAACGDGACGGCSADRDCSAPTPRCDPGSGRCVPCLPDHDNCTAPLTCVKKDGGYACALPCRTVVDCPGLDGGGVAACCAKVCVDTQSDPDNCGACEACPVADNATTVCRMGRCGVGQCSPGFGDCNQRYADGCETPTTSDVANCGGCGNACPAVQNGAPTCQAGACGHLCNLGFLHCSGNPADGCEANIGSDPKNCGSCGNSCQNLGHATATCAQGLCVLGPCDAGWADCNKNPADGCEVALGTDVANCGACGKACSAANASAACKDGACAIAACHAGFTDCNGQAADGCETATASDVNNCGGCGKACAAPNGTPGCQGGACVVTGCAAGFADCNGLAGDGCEVALLVSVGNCGACGNACPALPNATAGCMGGKCSIGLCAGGFADCNGLTVDGCEANLGSPQTCGACNIACPVPGHASAACTAGACGIGACEGTFADCNGQAGDGCEVDVSADPASCGGCGKPCAVANATAGCQKSACTVAACNAGFADCNASATDGCEIQTAMDLKNCGGCGVVCVVGANASPTCKGGGCGIACNPGFADCDKNPATGCEIDTATDSNNCGGCGIACKGKQKCAGGVCGVVGGSSAAAMGAQQYGVCWYLGTAGSDCDTVCAATGGSNQAAAVTNAFADDCSGGAAGQPATWFFQNGNACNWSGPTGAPTTYKTLGHGYDGSQGFTTYYGKCTAGNGLLNGAGSFPKDKNNRGDRCTVCACSQ